MNLKNRTFTLFSDPSHGWLKVPTTLVNYLNLSPTPYSYKTATFLYLEEDCDAPRFLRTLESLGGSYTIKTKHTNRSSKIRNLPRA